MTASSPGYDASLSVISHELSCFRFCFLSFHFFFFFLFGFCSSSSCFVFRVLLVRLLISPPPVGTVALCV